LPQASGGNIAKSALRDDVKARWAEETITKMADPVSILP
jgi:hypothetical protein